MDYNIVRTSGHNGEGQKQRVSGRPAVQRSLARWQFEQRQGTAAGHGPGIVKGAAGYTEGSRRVRDQGPTNEKTDNSLTRE